MRKKRLPVRLVMCFLLIAIVLTTGCQNLLVGPSRSGDSEAATIAQWKKVFRQHLPKGAFLIEPSQDSVTSPPPPLIRQADLDNDGKDELIAGYRIGENTVGVLVLKHTGENWHKLWEARGDGPRLTLLQPVDVTGDDTLELLVGWGLDNEAGNQLCIVTFQDEIRILAEQAYHQLEVLDLSGDYGQDGKAELAIWGRIDECAYEVEVYRCYQQQLIPAVDTYRTYFPRVVRYYEQQVLAIPDQPLLWYYLADAQLKAGQPEDALKSIARAEDFDPTSFRPGSLAVLKADALLAQGKLQEAMNAYLKLARFDPEGIDRRDKARALYGLGRVKETLPGLDPAAAKADYKRALATDPNWLLPAIALERIESVPLTRSLVGYLSSLAPEKRAGGIDQLSQFAKEHDIDITYVTQLLGKERLRVVAADFGPADQTAGNVAHALFWWDGLHEAPVKYQVFYSAEAAFHGLCKNCTIKNLNLTVTPDNTVQAELLYEIGSQELRYKLTLVNGHWQITERTMVQ